MMERLVLDFLIPLFLVVSVVVIIALITHTPTRGVCLAQQVEHCV